MANDKRTACVDAADNPGMLFLDEFDEAIIGWADRDGETVAVYCAKRIVRILVEDGWDRADAWEHLGNNVIGAWAGPRTPIIVLPL